MPGPYTAFDSATPAVQHAIINKVAIKMVGLNFGNPASNPVPVAQILQGGVVGTAYSETVSEQRGTGPFTFAIVSGALPGGLAISSSGIISGTPTTPGTFNFTVQVTDANGNPGTQAFRIVIGAGGSTSPNYCVVN